MHAKDNNFFGKNGFGDIDVWKPHYPRDIKSIVQKKNAIEIIRYLVLQVRIEYLCFSQKKLQMMKKI